MNQTVPLSWRSWLYTTFANQYGANLDEIKDEITSFRSFRDFFTRELKPGARTIEDPENHTSIISPCDGKIFSFGDIHNATMLVVKNRTYTLDEFLFGDYESASSESYFKTQCEQVEKKG